MWPTCSHQDTELKCKLYEEDKQQWLNAVRRWKSPDLDSSLQSTGHLSLNMKEQHSSLWEAWLQTLWHSQMWWVHQVPWYHTWGMEMYFFAHATAFPMYFRKKPTHIQDTFNRSLVLARGEKNPTNQTCLFTASQFHANWRRATTTAILSSPFQITQYCKTCNQTTRTGKLEDIYNIMNYTVSQRLEYLGETCILQSKDMEVTLL